MRVAPIVALAVLAVASADYALAAPATGSVSTSSFAVAASSSTTVEVKEFAKDTEVSDVHVETYVKRVHSSAHHIYRKAKVLYHYIHFHMNRMLRGAEAITIDSLVELASIAQTISLYLDDAKAINTKDHFGPRRYIVGYEIEHLYRKFVNIREQIMYLPEVMVGCGRFHKVVNHKGIIVDGINLRFAIAANAVFAFTAELAIGVAGGIHAGLHGLHRLGQKIHRFFHKIAEKIRNECHHIAHELRHFKHKLAQGIHRVGHAIEAGVEAAVELTVDIGLGVVFGAEIAVGAVACTIDAFANDVHRFFHHVHDVLTWPRVKSFEYQNLTIDEVETVTTEHVKKIHTEIEETEIETRNTVLTVATGSGAQWEIADKEIQNKIDNNMEDVE